MKKKTILFNIICFIALIALTGCGNKKAITLEEFKSEAQKENLTISDTISQFKNYSQIKSATAAKSSDGWQVEFYVLDSNDSAISMFNTNKEIFENSKNGLSSNSSISLNNYESYVLKTNGYYKSVSRIDNTLVFVNVLEKHEDSVKDFLKKLGY